MSYNLNDVIEFQLQFDSGTWTGQKWRNSLVYRVTAGELPYDSAENLVSSFDSTVLDRIMPQHLNTTNLRKIRLINRTRLATPEYVQEYGPAELVGALDPATTDIAEASACITRYTWSRGRASIGRYFHGPLASRFIDGGRSIEDPDGTGDLGDICDALGDAIGFGGLLARPVVVSANAVAATAGNEVRKNVVAQLVTFMKSRRIGKGE